MPAAATTRTSSGARPAAGAAPAPSGQRIGYVRVSTLDQSTTRQLDGVPLDRVFEDRASGKDVDRPQLAALLAYARHGDTVVVHSMDRLARNLDDLRRIVRDLTGRGVRVEFKKEGLAFTGDDAPMSTLLLSVMGAFAEFERALIRERQREGIALARRRGVYKGRKPALTAEQAAEALRRVEAGVTKARVARDLGVARETLYQHLRALDRAASPPAKPEGPAADAPQPPPEDDR